MKIRSLLIGIHRVIPYIALSGLLLIAYHLYVSPTKFAYVNTAKLVNEFKGMKDARILYQRKESLWKANIDTLSTELRKQIIAFDSDSKNHPLKDKQASKELLDNKQRQLAEYQQAIQTQAREEEHKITQAVISEVNAYLKKYGESHRYKIVIAATEYGNIAYADDGMDITDEVLVGLNDEYQTRK